LIGLNGYTISSGVINPDLNGEQITAVRLRTDERMLIGYIVNAKANPSLLAANYIGKLKAVISDAGYRIMQQEDGR
jgi:hypothetical protein